jgi:8-oxo-dGTP pyrophosphatase MutT (NUDIX family)
VTVTTATWCAIRARWSSYRSTVDDTLLEVPAGKRDVPGEPPEETARRELMEEIGMNPERLVPIAEFYNSPGFTDEYTYLYAAFDIVSVGSSAPVGPEEKAMTIERVGLGEIDALIADRKIIDAKSIIGLLLTRAYLQGSYGGLVE